MTLGALIDAGADFDTLKKELEKLGITEFELSAEKVVRRGISATDVSVHVHHHGEHHHCEHHHGRSYSQIKQIIEQSNLSENVKSKSTAIFTKLGEAEAKIHDKDIDEIHFHEVGAVDSIVDIVGACICIDLLGIEKIYSSQIPTFTGMVDMAHGKFPLPAPATLEILKGIPWRTLGIEGEIVTPTGAAILATLAESFAPMPQMVTDTTGYGAGKKDFGLPNVLRVMIGELETTSKEKHSECGEVVVIETNIDDVSPQIYEVVMERLFAAGALDVYMTPIQMKKNRPATLLSVLCKPTAVKKMSVILFEETSTIGVRIDTRKRMCLPREIITVDTAFGPIRIKVARRSGEVVNIQPEYEDCKAAAAKSNLPVKRVRDAAIVEFYAKMVSK